MAERMGGAADRMSGPAHQRSRERAAARIVEGVPRRRPAAAAPTVAEALASELTGDDARRVALEFCRQVERGCEEAARHQQGVFEAVKQMVADRLGTPDDHT
jgi:hypothetical protein